MLMLTRVSLRYLLRHPWQTVLSIVGIALGVAVVVSIDLVNHSARVAFSLSTEAVVGRATHQIVGGTAGLDENLYALLRTELGITQTAPIIEGYGQTTQGQANSLHIIGVDFFAERVFRPYLAASSSSDNDVVSRLLAEANTTLLSTDALRRLKLRKNDILPVQLSSGLVKLTIVGSFQSNDTAQTQEDILIVDIATAQEIFKLGHRLSRIDLVLPPGEAGRVMQARIKAMLPPHGRIIDTATRSQALAQMTNAFQLNLTAMSLLAIVVGMFLIYNTMAFSIVQRRAIIGILRAIGVTRMQIFRLIIFETLLIGTIGVTIGLVAGVLLAQGLLHYVIQTINDLYFTLQVSSLDIAPMSLFKGALLGIAATIVAALVPAIEATTTQPRAVIQRAEIEARFRRIVPYLAILGTGFMLIAGVLFIIPSRLLEISFLALFLVIAGFALWVPAFIRLLTWLAQKPFYAIFGLIGSMASRGINSSLSRTAVAVAALTVAVSASVGVTVMIDSFRHSVIVWLENSLRADIYVSVGDKTLETTLGLESLSEQIAILPGVRSISVGRRTTIETQAGPVGLFAVKIPQAAFSAFRFKESTHTTQDKFFNADGVIISEPYAFRHKLSVNDKLILPTDRGEHIFTVAGIYFDYSSDQGLVTMHRDTYQRFWDDPTITSLGVYANQGANEAELLRSILSLIANTPGVTAQSNSSLRQVSLEIFDRTFAITYILRLLAVLVAFVGILSALMAIQLERAREFAVLRALGLLPGQLAGLITLETALMGIMAGLLAIPLGIILAAILVFVVNQRSFGWSMDFILDPLLFAQAIALALIAATLAAAMPAYRITHSPPAVFLRNE